MEEDRQAFFSDGATGSGQSQWKNMFSRNSNPASTPSYIPMTDLTDNAQRPISRSPVASENETYGFPDSEQSSRAGLHKRKAGADVTSTYEYQPQQLPNPPYNHHAHFFLNWYQEIAACFLFVAALLAMFATLYAYTDRPSPRWPSWLSLNTIIAIYVVLLKTGILLVTAEGLGQLKWSWFAKANRPLADLVRFDDATRGPFGATKLLWALKVHHILSSLGALIILLSLAVDPFAQQIVRYYDCSPTVPDQLASMPRTNYYAELGGVHTGALAQSIVPGVQRAINAGVFSPSSSPNAHCSTGNCTWTSEYSTVGWCSKCEDISHLLQFKNTTLYEQYANQTTHRNDTVAFGYNYTTEIPTRCNQYECLTGVQVNMTWGGSPTQNYAAMGTANIFGSYLSDTGAAITQSIDFVLAKDIQLSTDPPGTNPSNLKPFPFCSSTEANETLWPCKGYGASRCTLYPCVKTFTASINAGKLTETLQDVASDWQGEGYNGALNMLDTKCLLPSEIQSLRKEGYKITDGERWLGYNVTFPLTKWQDNHTFPESMMVRDCLFAADLTFMESIAGQFSEVLTGTLTGGTFGPDEPLGFFTGPQIVQSFFNFGDVTFDRVEATFANITASLTNYMRENGMANFSKPAIGFTTDSKTCISVRWPFLVFPTALAILTLVFFVLMLLETCPTGLRPQIWKSSPLALLYHGLASGTTLPANSHAGSDVSDIRRMNATARATTVRLNNTFDDKPQLEVQRSG